MKDWKEIMLMAFDECRKDFVENPSYRGLDLDFKNCFEMRTGFSADLFDELNNTNEK